MRRNTDQVRIIDSSGDISRMGGDGWVVFTKGKTSYWQKWEDADGGRNFSVRTAEVPADVLRRHRDAKVKAICTNMSITIASARSMSRSRKVMEKVMVMMSIVAVYGDRLVFSGEETLSTYALFRRWGHVFGPGREPLKVVKGDDFIISKYDHGYACGTAAGKMLGCYKTKECGIAAVSRAVSKLDARPDLYELSYVGDAPALSKVIFTPDDWFAHSPVSTWPKMSIGKWRRMMVPLQGRTSRDSAVEKRLAIPRRGTPARARKNHAKAP